MLRICICDDDKFYGTRLEDYIMEYISNKEGIEVDVDIYESGVTLAKQISTEQESYQILYLDIEMEGMNGIETAKLIRQIDKELVIIYVTSYEKYTLESFEVSPFRYLIKPIEKDAFHMVLEQAINEVMLKNQYLFFKAKNRQYQVKCDRIVTIMSEKGRMVEIHTSDSEDVISFYGKIKDIEKLLNPFSFVKINPGTIVNLNFVYIITNSEIKLTTNEILPISRGQKSRVKNVYNDFLKRKIGI